MSEFVDYRPQIKLSQAGCNAQYYICDYGGRERTFFYMTGPDCGSILGHVTSSRSYCEGTVALTISNFYENWKEYLVPAHLTLYKISKDELLRLNGGKELWLNCQDVKERKKCGCNKGL